MFVGHAALALAAKRSLPRVSLGWTLAATFWIDLVWPVFLLLGFEHVTIDPGNTAFTPLDFVQYPWTHSLVMVAVWAIVFGGVAGLAGLSRRAQIWLGALVASHWVLDVLSHRPDMPLWPGTSPLLGLGLWYSIPATLVVEGALFATSVWMYTRATQAVDRLGRYAFWSLIGLAVVVWASGPFSPPPPDERTLAWAALVSWLLPLWGWWADKHRRAVDAAVSAF